MFAFPADGNERLALQPVAIPRQHRQGRLYFYLVISGIRSGGEGYHPRSQRKQGAPAEVEVPDCFAGLMHFGDQGQLAGFWPKYVKWLLASGKLTASLFASTATAQALADALPIRLHQPHDLHHAGWSVDEADRLWERLIVPAAEEEAAALRSRPVAQLRNAAWAATPDDDRRGDLNPLWFENVPPNPWSASDLRPNLRFESINTRVVAETVEKFIVQEGASTTQPNSIELLFEKDPELLTFVELRDSEKELSGLLRALQSDDPKFKQDILPDLRNTAPFQQAIEQLMHWRAEYLLASGRSEFLRQTRFVDSARHRTPLASTAAVAPMSFAWDSQQKEERRTFEQHLAQLRQHPGLMRRLYLTLSCSIPWSSGDAGYRDLLEGGVIGIDVDQHVPDFVCLTTKTVFDLDCRPASRAYFRPAPSDRVRFFGPMSQGGFDTKAQEDFRKFHTLSTKLYQVTQDDPSQAMLRASQSVADANQISPEQIRTAEQDKRAHRINAINIYQRAYDASGKEIPIAQAILDRTREDHRQLTAYNEHVRDVIASIKGYGGLIKPASFAKLVQAQGQKCPPLFYAENLMMGYTVFVQPDRGSSGRTGWRSLNRRRAKLTIAKYPGYVVEFDEESVLATSVIVPPRPLSGTATAVTAAALEVRLVDNQNTAGATERISIDLSPSRRTEFIQPTKLFNNDAVQTPIKGDVVLVALRGKENEDAGHPRAADQVFVHPVLRAENDVLKSYVTASGLEMFRTPVVLNCGNQSPEPGSGARANWRARIVFAPHFTRVVDYLGTAVVPKYLAPQAAPNNAPAPKPFKDFVYFTAETAERQFAQLIGEDQAPQSATQIAEKSPLGYVMTNVGPINQVAPIHLLAENLVPLQFPDPKPDLPAVSGLVNPLPPPSARTGTLDVAQRPAAGLHVLRGAVRKIGFVFVLNLVKATPPGTPHEFRFKDGTTTVETWYVPETLSVPADASNTPITLQPIECPKVLLPKGITHATVVARGGVTITKADGATRISLTVETLDVSVPTAQIDTGGVPLRWDLELDRIDGGVVHAQFDVAAKLPANSQERLVHPLDAAGRYVEVITANPGPRLLASGFPQHLFGTLAETPNGSSELRFTDGQSLPVRPDASVCAEELMTGFFPVQPVVGQAPTISNTKPQPFLIVAEVTRVDVTRVDDTIVELTDAYGQSWRIAGASQLDLDLPLAHVAQAVRRVRNLQPGEWLIAECHAAPGTRSLLLLTKGPFAKARTALWGRITAPPAQPISKAAEGAAEYRPLSYRSQQGRVLPIWGDTTPQPSSATAWTQRLVLAETLAQYEIPDAAMALGRTGRLIAFQPGANAAEVPSAPKHVMVSELITRWANWGIGLQLPGRADESSPEASSGGASSPAKKEFFEIRVQRPDMNAISPAAQAPFDRESWLLPALRFGRDYRFCMRRADLAGNHSFDGELLPDPVQPSVAALSALVGQLKTTKFVRANLAVAPLVAFTPDHLESVLRPPPQPASAASGPSPIASVPAVRPSRLNGHAVDFLYVPSDRREPTLILLTDVLDPERREEADSFLELLPPPIDVESMLLHGPLDGKSANEAFALISRHERYFDVNAEEPILGRLKKDGELNYLPDPQAGLATVTAASPQAEDCVSLPHRAPFFGSSTADSLAVAWPHIRWIRLKLSSDLRQRRRNSTERPWIRPQTTAAATTLSIHLPPGATGEARLSVRPPQLDEDEYLRMVRDHGSDTRTVQLVHATNGAWTRPVWTELREAPRDPEAVASVTRDLTGTLDIDRLTTGACSVTAYWNDPWDELLPAQHEHAHAVVEVNHAGQAVAARLVKSGFGFGTQAVVVCDSAGLPFRKPTFQAVLRGWKLHALEPIDRGAGCQVLFRIKVTQAAACSQYGVRPALAEAWHDEAGKLHVRIIDHGDCLGPCVDIHVVAARPVLPQLGFDLLDGRVANPRLISPGSGKFTHDLDFRIFRRPPFYRVAEGRVATFNPHGGIGRVEVIDGGGWYASPPYCIAHDPTGDGFGAQLVAQLDEAGGVIGVSVACPGKKYSSETRISFYNQLSEIAEQSVEPATATHLKDPFALGFQQTFPNPHARRVDYFARALSRFRNLLIEEGDQARGGAECDPTFASGRPQWIRRHVPRISPARNLEVQSHIRPEKPDIAYLMPAFEWKTVSPLDEPDLAPANYFAHHPEGRIVLRRDARVRVYLHRPWHGTGPEHLAVIVAPSVTNTTRSTTVERLDPGDGGVYNPAATPGANQNQPGFLLEPVEGYAIDDNLRQLVSRWGYDPVWNEAAFPPLTVDHFPRKKPELIYDQLAPSDATASNGQLTLRRPLWIAPHEVHYDSVKDLWYCDVQVDVSAGVKFSHEALPFLRLALARYQEHGLPGRRLSPVALCDMYKLIGLRELEVSRTAERSFEIRLRGEFDQTPEGSPFPRREVVARIEARDPDLSEEIVHYLPPPHPRGQPRATTETLTEFALALDPRERSYRRAFEIPPDVWRSARRLNGRPSRAVLSVLEYEIFPTAEAQSDRTGVELLVIEGRMCARRLVYSSTFHLHQPDAQ